MSVDFSTILSTTKPKERSDEFIILGALYALKSDKSPAPVGAIKTLLDLHRARLPTNLSTSLRRCKAHVEPIPGQPLRWKIKPSGIARLREITGLDLPASTDEIGFGCDVGFVCALERPELEALRSACGTDAAWKEIGEARYTHVYRESALSTRSGKVLRVVATASTSMGLTAAAIATTQLIMQFRPRLVVMVGIAAGTHSGDKQFGDVLVADPSVDYNSGKVVDVQGIRDFLPDPYPIGLNPRLRSVLQKYSGDPSVFQRIRDQWGGELPVKANRAHIGPLGAADQVIDDHSRILEITSHWRKLVGVEMETYAVYRACHESPEPKPRFVSFKAVCDFAANKGDSWQAYAAFTAAHFAVDFLKTEWDALWPSS
ncbi:MAG: hypothetical protein NW206_02485 [Hyphomonadaceae bacterium]|nr:hypothetical protein [Hyphomonadaceae bacterium]